MNLSFDPKNRQQLLMALAFGVVGIWAADNLVISPLIRSWNSRTEGIADLRKKVADGQQLLTRERSLRDRWKVMQTNTLPTELSVAEGRVLGAFDGWSRDSRVSVTSIKPQWKRTADHFMVLECRVDAAGSLSTLTRFLYEVEADPLALKVDSVEIGSRDSTGGQLTLGLQVSGLVLSTEKR
jgi:hypothetical protein